MSLRRKFFAATYDRQMNKIEKAGLTEIVGRALLAQAAGGCSRSAAGPVPTWPTTGLVSRR